MTRFHTEESDEALGEYYSYDGTTEIYLGGHLTEWGLYDTLIHEALHEAIEECIDDTTEKQDHWAIQRICF
jgi:hypothetical protein